MDLNQRLTRLRAPLDSNGEPNWSTPEVQWTKDTWWGSLQPVGSREDLVSQNRVESTHISRWEPAADITAYDRVRDAKGKDYTVDGEPGDWSDVGEYGQEAHWKVFLKRITGG
jgi:hypothetical protein